MEVGLVGNQNSGKTTLFNYLTGMNAKKLTKFIYTVVGKKK